jgi:hypothetical protein
VRPGETLRTEFMEPMGMSAYALEPCNTRAISTTFRSTRYTTMNGSGAKTSSRVSLTRPGRPRWENDSSEVMLS